MSEAKGPSASLEAIESQPHWRTLNPQEGLDLIKHTVDNSIIQRISSIVVLADLMASEKDPSKKANLDNQIQTNAQRIKAYTEATETVAERIKQGQKLPVRPHGGKDFIDLDELIDFENQRLRQEGKLGG